MKLRITQMGLILFLVVWSLSCGTTQGTQGNQKLIQLKKTWDNYERTYYVHLPPQEKMNQPLPLLFVLHGGGGNARQMSNAAASLFDQFADRDGGIVVYPQGYEKHWNDGRNLDLATAWSKNMDDVGFITSIVDDLKSEYDVDENRIFTTGISNGGFMSTRLLCDRADVFRGGAIVTATISEEYFPKCNPSQPTGILVINGTDDPLVPYQGGDIMFLGQKRGKVLSTDDFITFWLGKNGCSLNAHNAETIDNKNDGTSVEIRQTTYCSSRGAVQLYKIVGGGHTWPGARSRIGEKLVGKTSKEINASQVIWDFFKSLD